LVFLRSRGIFVTGDSGLLPLRLRGYGVDATSTLLE
jgi:hypothetical protein